MSEAAENTAEGRRPDTHTPVGRKPASVGPRARNLRRTLVAKWKNVFLGTCRRVNRDRILATAAGVVFYGLLAIFPAITARVSSYGLFADPSTISKNLHSLSMMLPEGSFAIVQDEVGRVVEQRGSSLGLTFVFGLLFAIWSANSGTKAIIDALNVADEEEEERGFFKLNLVYSAVRLGHQNECRFATARNRAARQIFDRRSQAGRESRPAPAPNHVALAENTRHGAIFEARLWVSERR
jgi:membrane protein